MPDSFRSPASNLTFAVPKGRVLTQLIAVFEAAGLDATPLVRNSRQLVRAADGEALRFLLLKPDDVPTYVEYGAADLGVVGRDVLLEREYDLYAPLDLNIGKCRMVVAGLPGRRAPHVSGRALRVATKYPNAATRHFMLRGEQVETIFVQGSVELAPLTGLADVILDLVESGETLRQNGLVEFEEVSQVSSVVVANRVGLKLKRDLIAPLLKSLLKGKRATDVGARVQK